MTAFMRLPKKYPPLLHALEQRPLKVSVIGSGNWGTAAGKIVASNAGNSHIFDTDVRMWVFEESVKGKPLSVWINEQHENPKYLPGVQLPSNLRAVPSLKDACHDADMLIFVLPHQFLEKACRDIASYNTIPAHCRALSLIKGLYVQDGKYPQTMTWAIQNLLNIAPACALGGANVAKDIATGDFAEATLGFDPSEHDAASLWQCLFDTPDFKVNALPDLNGVQVCGAIKNILAMVGGFCDGLEYGTNTKAALIRLGVKEMELFGKLFFDDILADTFLDSAGYADVITTVFGGRNAKCAKEFIRFDSQKSWETIENELLNGQKLQGTLTLKEVHQVIVANELQHLFPLFMTTYAVAFENADPHSVVNIFRTNEKRPIPNENDCMKLQSSSLVQQARESIAAARRLSK